MVAPDTPDSDCGPPAVAGGGVGRTRATDSDGRGSEALISGCRGPMLGAMFDLPGGRSVADMKPGARSPRPGWSDSALLTDPPKRDHS